MLLLRKKGDEVVPTSGDRPVENDQNKGEVEEIVQFKEQDGVIKQSMRLHLRSLFPKNQKSKNDQPTYYKNDFPEQTNVTKVDNNQTEGDVVVDVNSLDNDIAQPLPVKPIRDRIGSQLDKLRLSQPEYNSRMRNFVINSTSKEDNQMVKFVIEEDEDSFADQQSIILNKPTDQIDQI